MNKKGNMMIGMIMFIMALAVFVVYLSPMGSFIEMAQGSNNLNCRNYVDESATPSQNYTYNSSLNTDTLSCLGIKLMLPFLVLIFIIGGIYNLVRPGGSDVINLGG